MLLGSMGLSCPGRCQKLYGLVRKPLATLHRAAGEPLRQAPNDIMPVWLGKASPGWSGKIMDLGCSRTPGTAVFERSLRGAGP